ncbi:hypothetical protein TNCV_640941 [Trichonephila clavipes]|nr:hypothetical protein TNCV_640941 [Trichonephila clavipes]
MAGAIFVKLRFQALGPLRARSVERQLHVKYIEPQTSPVGMVWMLREWRTSSGVILVTSRWFKTTRTIAKSPRAAE